MAAHHGPAARRDVARRCIDLDELGGSRVDARRLVEQRDRALGLAGEPRRLGRLHEQAGAALESAREPRRAARRRPRRPRMRCDARPRAPACSSAAEADSSVPIAAAARCHARRSTSRSGRAPASARWASRRCSAGAGVDRRTRERVAELERPAAQRRDRRPRPPPALRDRCRARLRRARASADRRCHWSRRGPAPCARVSSSVLDSAQERARHVVRDGQRRSSGASASSRRRGRARAARAGCRRWRDAVCWPRGRRPRQQESPRRRRSSRRVSASADRRRRAATARPRGPRSATAIGSASRRRNANSSAWALESSSQWASSTAAPAGPPRRRPRAG